MKVVLTDIALADIDEIADWIARDSLERGLRFADRLQQRCAGLARHPRRFPVVAGGDIRKFAYRGYLIFYRIVVAQIDVIRVVHGARDWAALLDEIAQ